MCLALPLSLVVACYRVAWLESLCSIYAGAHQSKPSRLSCMNIVWNHLLVGLKHECLFMVVSVSLANACRFGRLADYHVWPAKPCNPKTANMVMVVLKMRLRDITFI